MPLEDKWLKCQDCGDEFLHTAKDQRFYAEKGFGEPKRCKPCRALKKQRAAARGQYD